MNTSIKIDDLPSELQEKVRRLEEIQCAQIRSLARMVYFQGKLSGATEIARAAGMDPEAMLSGSQP